MLELQAASRLAAGLLLNGRELDRTIARLSYSGDHDTGGVQHEVGAVSVLPGRTPNYHPAAIA